MVAELLDLQPYSVGLCETHPLTAERTLSIITKCAVVWAGRVYIPAKVVKTNGSVVFSPMNHRDQSVNLQGRTFTVSAICYVRNAVSTHSAGHIDSFDVKLTLIFVNRGPFVQQATRDT